MSTVEEIEAAIRALGGPEREKLAADLPFILPELNTDTEWSRIVNDPAPSSKLSALGDAVAEKIRTNPKSFPEIKDR
jgi:hypothetical protein